MCVDFGETDEKLKIGLRRRGPDLFFCFAYARRKVGHTFFVRLRRKRVRPSRAEVRRAASRALPAAGGAASGILAKTNAPVHRPAPIYNPGITHLSYIRSSFQSRNTIRQGVVKMETRFALRGTTGICPHRHTPYRLRTIVGLDHSRTNVVYFFLLPLLLHIPRHDSALFAIYNPTTKGEWVRVFGSFP